jgi:Protein of unknown function (DUF2589)
VPVTDISALGLGELLGSLLTAIVEGQAAATGSALDFVERVGLTGTEKQEFRTVSIRYTKLDENQEPAEFDLELPLLALVNVPTITVSQAKISFHYEVVTTTKETSPADEEDGPLVTKLRPVRPVTLVGYVPRRTSSKDSTERTGIDVEVTVESQNLPVGLERLLDLTELAQSRPVENP